MLKDNIIKTKRASISVVLSELSPVNYVIFTMFYAEKKGLGLRD